MTSLNTKPIFMKPSDEKMIMAPKNMHIFTNSAWQFDFQVIPIFHGGITDSSTRVSVLKIVFDQFWSRGLMFDTPNLTM